MTNPFEEISARLGHLESSVNQIGKRLEQLTRSENEEVIGGISLAEKITGLAKPTIYTLASQRKIPCMKRGKKLYFSKDSLISWIKDGRRKTVAEIGSESEDQL